MAKKENLKEFVIQQSDIDKALKYHLVKAVSHSNPTSKDHSDLIVRNFTVMLLKL